MSFDRSRELYERACRTTPGGIHSNVRANWKPVPMFYDRGEGSRVWDADAMMQIFDPFFSTKKAAEHSGTGLGLAIVHGVIKEHEGFLDVTTSAAGTTVCRASDIVYGLAYFSG